MQLGNVINIHNNNNNSNLFWDRVVGADIICNLSFSFIIKNNPKLPINSQAGGISWVIFLPLNGNDNNVSTTSQGQINK